MPQHIRITEVAPRDGLQNEPGVIPTEAKIQLIEQLAACGFDEIEVTSFVSPKWIPQLADAEQVLEGLRHFVEGVRMVAGAIPRTGNADPAGLPLFSVLVPNEKGLDRALTVHQSGLPLKIALFSAASEAFAQRNINATIAQSIDRFRPIIPRALDAGMPIRIYISCAIACPFDGPTDPAQVRRVADQLLDLAPDDTARARIDLDLADTIGVAHPDDITALLSRFTDLLPQLTLHLHDTHHRAPACISTALAMGVRSFDASAAGLGGCPFASTPSTRAPGNIATHTLLKTILDSGYASSVDPELLQQATHTAQRIVTDARDAT